jgi:molybdopterin converting factor small subunit
MNDFNDDASIDFEETRDYLNNLKLQELNDSKINYLIDSFADLSELANVQSSVIKELTNTVSALQKSILLQEEWNSSQNSFNDTVNKNMKMIVDALS